MSSLIFSTDENEAVVATDSLAVSNEGKPFGFSSKAFFIPHLRTVVAGTGGKGFLDRWLVCLNGMVVRGIDHLNYHASRNLPSVWLGYKNELTVPIPENFTTTIYHFGFSEVTGLIHSYAYRSTSDFQSDPIAYGTYMKPACSVPDPFQFPRDIKTMMDEQRAIQSSQPKEQKLYIGGEIHIHHLQREGCAVYTLDRFDDYESDEKAIYENFAAMKNEG